MGLDINNDDRRRVLREQPAATYCGLSPITFRRLRKAGSGPRAVRLGERYWGYRLADLDDWLEQRAGSAPAHPDPGRVGARLR